MIELNEVQENIIYTISLPEAGSNGTITVAEGTIGFSGATTNEYPSKVSNVQYAVITLTGYDLKKLVMLLNLSIGNLPHDAPDITAVVEQITKGIGFQKQKFPD